MYFSAWTAAIAPSATAVTTWRSDLTLTSPAANTPSTSVFMLSSVGMYPDWSNLILASSVILFPVIFYKLSFKIIFNRLINNGTITASSFKHMRSPRKANSKSDGSGNGGYSSDSGGDCGGGGGE